MERDSTETPGAVDLDKDTFMLRLIRDLSGTLQDVVGAREARGFVSVAGARMGDHLDRLYRRARGKEQLDEREVLETLIDLKRRIGGRFYEIEHTPDRMVLGNRRCPFGDMVKDRPALCMMTSTVFGRIAAQNLGYARVVIEEAIARGDCGCRITIHLKEGRGEPSDGIEYYRVSEHDQNAG